MIEKKESINRFQKAEIKRTYQSVSRVSKDIERLSNAISKIDVNLKNQIEALNKKAEEDKLVIKEKIQKQIERVNDLESVIIKYYGHPSTYFCQADENGSVRFLNGHEPEDPSQGTTTEEPEAANTEASDNTPKDDEEKAADDCEPSNDDKEEVGDCADKVGEFDNQMDYFSKEMNRILDDF